MAAVRNIRKTPVLRRKVADSLESMTWLHQADAAMAELALTYASSIDAAVILADYETLGKLGPQLVTILRSLGGAPPERKSLGVEGGAAHGKLASLRAARQNAASTLDEAETASDS